jgi:hypothetical protein
MPIPPDSRSYVRQGRSDLWMTTLASAGPVLWYAALVVDFSIWARGCPRPVWSWSILGLSVLGSGAAIARLLKTSPDREGRRTEPAQFLRWSGVAFNVLSLVLLVGLGIPLLFPGTSCE